MPAQPFGRARKKSFAILDVLEPIWNCKGATPAMKGDGGAPIIIKDKKNRFRRCSGCHQSANVAFDTFFFQGGFELARCCFKGRQVADCKCNEECRCNNLCSGLLVWSQRLGSAASPSRQQGDLIGTLIR